MAGVVGGDTGPHEALAGIHAQLGGQKVAQQAGLGVVEVAQAGLVALLPVGKDQQLVPVGGLPLEPGAVPLLVLLLPAHAQGLGGDLLEVALPGAEHVHRVVRGLVLRVLRGGGLVLVDDLRPPGDGVLLLHRLELGHDELLDAAGVVHDVLEVGDLLLQPGHLLNALEDVLLVDVAQLDVGHVLGLHVVDAEADHQVGHHLVVLLGLPDDFDGPVDVQQDLFQAAEQV